MAKTDVGHTAAVTFHLTIDYTQSLAEMVAAGNYDHVDRGITDENFPVGKGAAEVEAILVHLARPATTEGVLAWLDCHGLRPATGIELLAFGAQYPDQQREFPIVALGSVWMGLHGSRRVGCLGEGPDDRRIGCLAGEDTIPRELYLGWFDDRQRARYRFLAVRK